MYAIRSYYVHNIALSSGTVSVRGDGIPEDHEVYVAGRSVPVDESGSFVTEHILPRITSYNVCYTKLLRISDDPNVDGPADPTVAGDENPTQILIESAPAFDIDKISSYNFV